MLDLVILLIDFASLILQFIEHKNSNRTETTVVVIILDNNE